MQLIFKIKARFDIQILFIYEIICDEKIAVFYDKVESIQSDTIKMFDFEKLKQ